MGWIFVAIGVVGAVGMFAPLWGPALKRVWLDHRPLSETARIIVGLLREHPNEWEADRYIARHPTGPKIWIGNEDYGLSVTLDCRSPSPRAGSVPLTDADKRAIWLAWLRVHNNREQRAVDTQVAAFAKAVLDRYDQPSVH